jgi:hypothetical protein
MMKSSSHLSVNSRVDAHASASGANSKNKIVRTTPIGGLISRSPRSFFTGRERKFGRSASKFG